MNKPIISIIVPIYNVEQFLHCCIDSILAQTFTDWELLLIDDGSPDRSGEICDEYAAKDSRVRVFHKENGGVSNARNLGLDNARGEWVTFVDADDIIQPGFLRGLLAPTEEYEALDFVQAGCCNYRNEKIVGIEQQYELYVGNDPAYLFNHFRGLTFSKLFRLENVNHWSDGLPLRFDEEMRIAEDMAFTLDYILSVGRYAFVPETGYLYRRDNEGSATKTTLMSNFNFEVHAFVHLYNSTYLFINKYDLSEQQSSKKLRQLGNQLHRVFESAFFVKKSFKAKVSTLKSLRESEYFSIIKYANGSFLDRTIDGLLMRKLYYLSSLSLTLIIFLKKIKNKYL